jgi:hypothetical protein
MRKPVLENVPGSPSMASMRLVTAPLMLSMKRVASTSRMMRLRWMSTGLPKVMSVFSPSLRR